MKTMTRRIQGAFHRAGILVGAALLGGCITGEEAEDAMRPNPQREMTDLQMDHDIGVVSDVEYESRRERLLDEE